MNPQQMHTGCACGIIVTVHYSRCGWSENWWFSIRGEAVRVCPECGCLIEYDPARIMQPEARLA